VLCRDRTFSSPRAKYNPEPLEIAADPRIAALEIRSDEE
jgi:hypothetical protein